MMRITIVMFLLAALAGCYPATPFATRTGADRASQGETMQRWGEMNDSMTGWREARRTEAREARERDGRGGLRY